MSVIDAHHHLWDTTALTYERLEQIPRLCGSFLAGQYTSATQDSVEGAVCVEAASAGADGKAEVELLMVAIAAARIPIRLVAWAPVDQPCLTEHLEWLRDFAGPALAGIRMGFEHSDPAIICSKQVIDGVRSVGDAGLPFDVVVRQEMLAHVYRLSEGCPETILILNHLGKPRIDGPPAMSWRRDLENLAALPNVFCKISGLMTEAAVDTLNPLTYTEYIRFAIAAFGWERVMFGSDWPVCTLAGSYRDWLEIVRRAVSAAPSEDRERLFRSNAQGLYFANGTVIA